MTPAVKGDVAAIIEEVQQRALDIDTLYDHVHNQTLDKYYTTVLEEICSDLLALPIERQYLGLDPLDPKDDVDEVTNAIVELSLLVSSWFMKQPSTVERDFARIIQNTPAEDIREARFLLRHNLLN